MTWVYIGTLPGSGPGGELPPGAALIQDSLGQLAVQATNAESNIVPADVATQLLDLNYAESINTPTHTDDFIAKIDVADEVIPASMQEQSVLIMQEPNFDTILTPTMQEFLASLDVSTAEPISAQAETHQSDIDAAFQEIIAAQAETHTQEATITNDETNTEPTETNLSELAVASAESNAAPTEGASNLDITVANESIVGAVLDHLTTARIGAASVVASAPQSGGQFTNPNNSLGLPDQVYASVSTAAGLSTSTKGGTLIYTFPAFGNPTNETQLSPSSVVARVCGSMNIGALASGSLQFHYSTNSGGSWTQIGSTLTSTLNFNEANTPLTGNIPLNIADLSTFRIRIIGTCTNSLTGAVSIFIDSVDLLFNFDGAEG